MSEKFSTDLPGDKFLRSREASRSAERNYLLGAHNQYESLPAELQSEVDAFSEAITNVTIERVDAEFGDKWYGGADFNKKLTKLIRNFATGFSRNRESFEKALNSSVSERRVAEIAYELAESYLQSFPDLLSLELAPADVEETEEIETDSQREIIDAAVVSARMLVNEGAKYELDQAGYERVGNILQQITSGEEVDTSIAGLQSLGIVNGFEQAVIQFAEQTVTANK